MLTKLNVLDAVDFADDFFKNFVPKISVKMMFLFFFSFSVVTHYFCIDFLRVVFETHVTTLLVKFGAEDTTDSKKSQCQVRQYHCPDKRHTSIQLHMSEIKAIMTEQ